MKPHLSILVATDFSPTADNALTYALKLSEMLNAKLYVLHACRIPSASTAAYPAGYYEAVNMSELKLAAEMKMSQLQLEYLISSTVNYQCITQLGPVLDSIRDVAKEKQIDLIVMGTHKVSGMLEWLGSVTSDVAEKIPFPLLAIPNNVQCTVPRKFLLATTLTQHASLPTLDRVKELVKQLEAKLDVLCIQPQSKKLSSAQIQFKTALEHFLAGISHQLHIIDGEEVHDEIVKYAKQNEVDVLAMLPRQHNFFTQLFRSSKSRHMLFHTNTPLLLVHD